MSLLRLGLGWAGVTLWFLIFELVEQRVFGPPSARKLRAGWKLYFADGLLITLFAGLWFASLGHGGWVLLFLLLGLLIEGPARRRDGTTTGWSRLHTVAMILGVVRIVVAGGILAWRLGS